jgi:hypothetical protein
MSIKATRVIGETWIAFIYYSHFNCECNNVQWFMSCQTALCILSI